jgi:ABC-2 type transport system ATP-binding protein
MMNAIEITNLTKKFGSKTVLDNISLKIDENQVFGFIGKNGAGKSTLINILSGNVYKSDGCFKIFNYSDENEIDKIKKIIGVMPDVSNLYGEMNATQFIKYMSDLKGVYLSKIEIVSILNDVKLENVNKVKIKNFSFGMKKKISIAQAIIGNPKLIFLDEPTSGVDPESILYIHKLIQKLKDNGATIFLTSHNLSEIEKLCNVICILDKGNIKTIGNLKEIKENYKNTIKVNITYSNVSSSDLEKILDKYSDEKLKLFNIDKYKLTIEIKDKSNIPEIIKFLALNGVDIYSATQECIDLEEIFLN